MSKEHHKCKNLSLPIFNWNMTCLFLRTGVGGSVVKLEVKIASSFRFPGNLTNGPNFLSKLLAIV